MIDESLAKRRFFTLSLVRLLGVVLAFCGVAIIAKRWIEPADIVGGALLVMGAFDVLVIPRLLARRWRTPL